MTFPGINGTPAILQKYGYLPGAQQPKEDSELFLNLLVSQLKNQDPFEPLQNGEFIQQVSQLAAVEQSSALNDKLTNLIALQEIVAGQNAFTQSASLVGKKVEYIDPETGEEMSGVVKGVHLDGGGLMLDVEGSTVPMNYVTGIIDISGEGGDGEGEGGDGDGDDDDDES